MFVGLEADLNELVNQKKYCSKYFSFEVKFEDNISEQSFSYEINFWKTGDKNNTYNVKVDSNKDDYCGECIFLYFFTKLNKTHRYFAKFKGKFSIKFKKCE